MQVVRAGQVFVTLGMSQATFQEIFVEGLGLEFSFCLFVRPVHGGNYIFYCVLIRNGS